MHIRPVLTVAARLLKHLMCERKLQMLCYISVSAGNIQDRKVWRKTNNTDVISLALTRCSSQQATSHVECAACPDSPVSLPSLLLFPDAPDAAYMSERQQKDEIQKIFLKSAHTKLRNDAANALFAWWMTARLIVSLGCDIKSQILVPWVGLLGRWCPPAPPGVQTAPPGGSASPGRLPTLQIWCNPAQTYSGQRCIWQDTVKSNFKQTK